ncbi:mediator of RNA polymerase II transcription subunit 5 [Xylariaceae sp. FL0016]|nr:mediator of RNA polymerase II transcription subunit 5 [Xylariaceae sp. FL0016]
MMEMDIDGVTDQGRANARGHTRSTEQWIKFITHCLNTRLDTDTFDTYVALLNAKHPLPPAIVADICLRPQPTNRESLDPRISRYLAVLSQRKLVDISSTVKALYRYSTFHTHVQSHEGSQDDGTPKWGSSYASEDVFFWRLSKSVRLPGGIKNVSDALDICKTVAQWMIMYASAFPALDHHVMGQPQNNQRRNEMDTSRSAFVSFLLGVIQHQLVLDALSQPFAKDARQAFSDGLAAFIPSILQTSSDVAGRLEDFRTRTLASFEPIDKKKKETANVELDDFESSMALDSIIIPELPITNSRAGLYIYLNALLVGRPLLDDAILFSYLHNRYQGDIQATTIDLILASFDVLANAVFRREDQKAGHLLRSYLINKLPLLLTTLSQSMFEPLTAQFCITTALQQVDSNAFPTLSAMFDDTNNNNTFTDTVRQDFCFACCLHGLIPETAIETLLGEITYQTLPPGGQYSKDTLVEQCMTDPERVQSLIGELDNMDGNVGAVCQALIEVIGRLCNNKETIPLKLLCSQLAKKPLSLDVLLLFGKPQAIFHPLCELLDNWRYDEDQGEYQPVYEEFGSVLLLLLAFVFRYNLSAIDLGIRSQDSFVAKLLYQGQLSRPLDELSEQEKGHLDGWIHGLFDTEAGGLGDELMSSCPPQDFYLLVPTLFYNIVLAFGNNYLNEESLKTGVEYLVDTFLLPSLVMAITYMSNQLWTEKSPDQKAVIRILQLIILQKQGSTEAQSMLSAVLNIVAKPLEHGLRSYQRQDPKSQEIEPLLNAIKDNIRLSRRTAGAGHNELEAWSGTSNGGLAAAVRHTMQSFVQWGIHPGVNIMPTSYTHRQILAALKILGAKRLLHVILEEVKQQTEVVSGSIAHDVAVSLICAPDVTNVPPPTTMALPVDPNNPPVPPQTLLSLRAALKAEAADFKLIQKTDPAMAENVIRLYRRVEAQLEMPQPTETMLQAAALDDALAAAQNDGLVPNDASMSLDLGNTGSDLNLGGPDSTGGLDFGTDDDIFGSLGGGGGADLLEGWGDMELS